MIKLLTELYGPTHLSTPPLVSSSHYSNVGTVTQACVHPHSFSNLPLPSSLASNGALLHHLQPTNPPKVVFTDLISTHIMVGKLHQD